MSDSPNMALSNTENNEHENIWTFSIENPHNQFSFKFPERTFRTKYFTVLSNLTRTEDYYVTAIRNLLKKTNFLELYQQLLEDQISQESFHKELAESSNKYVVDIHPLANKEDINIIIGIVNRIGYELREFSGNEIDELFSTNISEEIAAIDSSSLTKNLYG